MVNVVERVFNTLDCCGEFYTECVFHCCTAFLCSVHQFIQLAFQLVHFLLGVLESLGIGCCTLHCTSCLLQSFREVVYRTDCALTFRLYRVEHSAQCSLYCVLIVTYIALELSHFTLDSLQHFGECVYLFPVLCRGVCIEESCLVLVLQVTDFGSESCKRVGVVAVDVLRSFSYVLGQLFLFLQLFLYLLCLYELFLALFRCELLVFENILFVLYPLFLGCINRCISRYLCTGGGVFLVSLHLDLYSAFVQCLYLVTQRIQLLVEGFHGVYTFRESVYDNLEHLLCRVCHINQLSIHFILNI